jgi:hypothetical protein
MVLNFHFRGPKKQRIPKWTRTYIIGYIGRFLCFCHESKHHIRSSGRTKGAIGKNHDNSLVNGTNHPETCINIQKLDTQSNPGTSKTLYGRTEFTGELNRSLEKMLLKMQKTFKPELLRDEDLKFAILQEILECQRLLLSDKIKNPSDTEQITLNEIYDEWKVLAMVVDRICFFFYLSALIFSTAIFFLREQILFSDRD